MALRLHAIVGVEPGGGAAGGGGGGGSQSESDVDGTSVVPFRDLGAIVSDQKQFAATAEWQAAAAQVQGAGQQLAPGEIETHRSVVDALFRRGAVLPAPVGVLFRTRDVLLRWMELHYVALNDALEFVEDRAVARVHIERADGKPEERETGVDLAAAAAEAVRALRRRAVAAVPLRTEKVTGLVLSAAFLVERDLWKEFEMAVADQREAHQHLRFKLTGPWAPYDFIRMQFGG